MLEVGLRDDPLSINAARAGLVDPLTPELLLAAKDGRLLDCMIENDMICTSMKKIWIGQYSVGSPRIFFNDKIRNCRENYNRASDFEECHHPVSEHTTPMLMVIQRDGESFMHGSGVRAFEVSECRPLKGRKFFDALESEVTIVRYALIMNELGLVDEHFQPVGINKQNQV